MRPMFRAWDEDLKEMFYMDKGHFMIGQNGQVCLFCSEWTDKLIKGGFVKEGRHKPKIIMQFTGLKDKKRTEEYPEGQEIYFDDLAKHKDDVGERIGKISWDKKMCNMCIVFEESRIFGGSDLFESCEVIGNIHELQEGD